MVLKVNNQLLSKIAAGDGHSPYFDGCKAYDQNPYHPTKNPTGVIQMGLAENLLCFDLVEEWVKNNPKASICTAEGAEEFKDIAIFQDYHGLPQFRHAVANFMGKVRGNRVTCDPDRMVMSGGATGAHETVAFCLADPGEAFMVPTPYYPGFDRDSRWRIGVQLVPVDCESSNQFKLTREALEHAYEMAKCDNVTIKGLLLTNPSNPLGTTLDKETLLDTLNFINDKNIHLICEEIYAGTVFSQPDFVSIAEVTEEVSNCNRDLIHIVCSLSKDMGFPGFRVGIVYSYSDSVVNCARKMSSFSLVSLQTQYLIASLLSDDEFIDKFIIESKRRLAKRHSNFTNGLALEGIKCLNTSNAGLFLWMDLRCLLKEHSADGEIALRQMIINDVKLNVSPGSSFHCVEPGWFRVCFANMDDGTMNEALSRIGAFMAQHNEALKPKRKLRWQGSIKLNSFSSRVYDDFIMSPHSPLAQSPLVRART